MQLKDKVAIVTGAGVGIGVEYSKRLAAEGAKVVCTDIQSGHAEATAKEIVTAGGDAIGFKADVTSKTDTDAMASRTQDQYDRIDILVNNAAMFTALPEGPFDELTEENWDRCMEVNLKGIWNCIRSVYPFMKAQRYGKIINISSVTWMMGRPYRLDYVTSKAGVVGLTHAIAPELGEYDINVNAVVLGLVHSDSAVKVYGEEHFQKIKDWKAWSMGAPSKLAVIRPWPMPSVIESPSAFNFPNL